MIISVHGARKKSTDESSNAYGSLLVTAQMDSSDTVEPLWSRPYTNPIWMAWNEKNKTNIKIRKTQTLRLRGSAERIQKVKISGNKSGWFFFYLLYLTPHYVYIVRHDVATTAVKSLSVRLELYKHCCARSRLRKSWIFLTFYLFVS